MTRIGILGSGRVASALARKLAGAGHQITMGTRDVARTGGKWPERSFELASPLETARAASLVINATPGDTSVSRLGAMRDELRGKILVDVANAMERGEDGLPSMLMYPNGSLAEALQQALPETRVVKTLNTMHFAVMVDPGCLSAPSRVFLSGDDESAKASVRELLKDLGWPVSSVDDLGGIATARGTEALALLVPAIIRKHGFAPFALSIIR